MKLKYEIPDAKAPGYLRREMKRLEWLALGDECQNSPELLPKYQEAMIEYLLLFIVEPKDQTKAREALLDASQEEVEEMQDAIIAGLNKPSPKASDSSDEQSSGEKE